MNPSPIKQLILFLTAVAQEPTMYFGTTDVVMIQCHLNTIYNTCLLFGVAYDREMLYPHLYQAYGYDATALGAIPSIQRLHQDAESQIKALIEFEIAAWQSLLRDEEV